MKLAIQDVRQQSVIAMLQIAANDGAMWLLNFIDGIHYSNAPIDTSKVVYRVANFNGYKHGTSYAGPTMPTCLDVLLPGIYHSSLAEVTNNYNFEYVRGSLSDDMIYHSIGECYKDEISAKKKQVSLADLFPDLANRCWTLATGKYGVEMSPIYPNSKEIVLPQYDYDQVTVTKTAVNIKSTEVYVYDMIQFEGVDNEYVRNFVGSKYIDDADEESRYGTNAGCINMTADHTLDNRKKYFMSDRIVEIYFNVSKTIAGMVPTINRRDDYLRGDCDGYCIAVGYVDLGFLKFKDLRVNDKFICDVINELINMGHTVFNIDLLLFAIIVKYNPSCVVMDIR